MCGAMDGGAQAHMDVLVAFFGSPLPLPCSPQSSGRAQARGYLNGNRRLNAGIRVIPVKLEVFQFVFKD